jgi:hypothetical protein
LQAAKIIFKMNLFRWPAMPVAYDTPDGLLSSGVARV